MNDETKMPETPKAAASGEWLARIKEIDATVEPLMKERASLQHKLTDLSPSHT